MVFLDEECPAFALKMHPDALQDFNDSCVCIRCGAAIVFFVMSLHSETDTDARQQGPDPALIKPTTLILEFSSQLFGFAELIIGRDIFLFHVSERLSRLGLEFMCLQSTRSHPLVCRC